MSNNERPILSATAEINLYTDFSNTYFFSVPKSVTRALGLERLDRQLLYVVLRDQFGNLIHQSRVQIGSGCEVKTSDFAPQIEAGMLYENQRIRLEVSLVIPPA